MSVDLFSILTYHSNKATGIPIPQNTPTTVVSLTTPSLPIGRYVFVYTFTIDFGTEKTTSTFFEITGDIVSDSFQLDPKSDVSSAPITYEYPVDVAIGGEKHINMVMTTASNKGVNVPFADLIVQRVGDL